MRALFCADRFQHKLPLLETGSKDLVWSGVFLAEVPLGQDKGSLCAQGSAGALVETKCGDWAEAHPRSLVVGPGAVWTARLLGLGAGHHVSFLRTQREEERPCGSRRAGGWRRLVPRLGTEP